MNDKKRIQVTFSNSQYEVIKKLKGELGVTDSEVVRNVVINWLIDKSFLSTKIKAKMENDKHE